MGPIPIVYFTPLDRNPWPLVAIHNSSPRQVEYILVSDRKTEASFLIYHYLSFYLREGCKVCFLGFVQSYSHYSAVSQRLGVSLDQARDSGQLLFLEGLRESVGVFLNESNPRSTTFDFLRDPTVGLQGLYTFIRGSVMKSVPGAETQGWGPPVLLVDDLSVFLSLGLNVRSVIDFSHYCRATVCSELQGSMVVLVRCDAEEESIDKESCEMLLKGLTHQCSLALHAQGLPTGFCRDIHGQVEMCWQRHGDRQQTQRKVFQYKVQDKGASFFAPGTSSASL